MPSHSLWLNPSHAVWGQAGAGAPQTSCLNNCFAGKFTFLWSRQDLTSLFDSGLGNVWVWSHFLSAFPVPGMILAQEHCFFYPTDVALIIWIPCQPSPAFNLMEKLFRNVIYCSQAPHKEKDALSVPCYNHSIHICRGLSEEYTG